MNILHSPEEKIDHALIQAVSGAIKCLETVKSTVSEYRIGIFDAQDLHYIKRCLWSILETNGYTMDIDTNKVGGPHQNLMTE